VNHKRVDRIYVEERLQIRRRRRKKVPVADRQPLIKPTLPNQVWSADFVFDRTAEGRVLKCLTIVDDQEFYQLLDKDGISDDIHLFNEKLREWEDYYNYHRPHGALSGQTPYERLLEKTRAEVLPGS
jgi:transposase InsO family protein